MANIILPQVNILSEINDSTKLMVEQDGQINRYPIADLELGGGDVTIDLSNSGNAEEAVGINAASLGGYPAEDYAKVSDLNDMLEIDLYGASAAEPNLVDADTFGGRSPEEYNNYINEQVRKAAPQNLLDNSDFRNPINQRGQTSYDNSTNGGTWLYTVDRWKLDYAKFTINDGYVNFATSKNAQYKRLVQIINRKLRAGESYTMAMCARVNEIGNRILWRPCSSVYSNIAGSPGLNITEVTNDFKIFTFSFTVQEDITNPGVDILILNTENDYANIDIKWIAWYEGEYTINTLPEYQPKGYAAELLECKRYFTIIGAYDDLPGHFDSTGKVASLSFFHMIDMRETPTVTSNGTFYARYAGKYLTTSTITNSSMEGNIVTFFISFTTAATVQEVVIAQCTSNIFVSADL